eukprot:TRINITY_DN62783_c0_g1_i1.p1 TRINITY_DN62783_c0_g1~~TRINITY_DN62783_c0_g1_i1.p1  ORF type:complete len:776 (+),score=149.25 TRINITY_DN62783_c0_g1_i1:90-2330(+)
MVSKRPASALPRAASSEVGRKRAGLSRSASSTSKPAPLASRGRAASSKPGARRGQASASAAGPRSRSRPVPSPLRNREASRPKGASAAAKAAPAPARAGRRRARGAADGEAAADDEEEEKTDDEDSDDGEREKLEERLGEEVEADDEQGLEAELDDVAKRAPHRLESAAVEYRVVIPTYQRWQPVCEMTGKKRFKNCEKPFILVHTLAFLAAQRIPVDRVTLFVADQTESDHYRRALKGSAWADVEIVISVLGNKNNRNFIFQYYPAGTYIVSVDDDVERISWKIVDGITCHTLRSLPSGGFEKLIFHAYHRMKEKKAFLWGVSTSQNPRHMQTYGISERNGLVNGYLNGFICRPTCTELLRQFADATEDSEFSVRHYAKDGIILRYRMYAGITSPYLNRGGLQTKFEAKGERITADERSTHRKAEERSGAMELHKLFPRLVGPPRPRRDKKTMEVDFYSRGEPPGEAAKRKMWAPYLRNEDEIEYYLPNPKLASSHSYKLYEGYCRAKTVEEAKALGARSIDFAFDYNWSYLQVKRLSLEPLSCECKVSPEADVADAAPADGPDKIKVRVLEMSEGHQGISMQRDVLSPLICRCPTLRGIPDEKWAAVDGPLAKVSLEILRILLYWAQEGVLQYARKQTKAVYAALKSFKAVEAARAVKLLEAADSKVARAAERAAAAVAAKASSRGGKLEVKAVRKSVKPPRSSATSRKAVGSASKVKVTSKVKAKTVGRPRVCSIRQGKKGRR